MFRKIVLTASAAALVAAGLGVSSGSSAFAAKPTITANTGSSVHCDITASVKLNPPLRDNWIKADHAGDANTFVKNLPNTTYAPAAPEHVTVKGAGTCTGTVTQDGGAHTYAVTKVKVGLVDEAAFPTTDPGTCKGLFVDDMVPSVARYKVTLSYTSPTAKVVATTVTHAEITATFGVENGTITGSFAGGTSAAQGIPDAHTLSVYADENFDGPGTGPKSATSTSQAAPNECQAGLKVKTTGATLKAPKGFKKITMVAGSTLDISKP